MTTTRVRARHVIAWDGTSHRTLRDGEVVFRGDTIIFVGRGYEGPVDAEIDGGNAVLGPGFIDLNALGDLDTTVLAFDNQPDWAKGRTWPEDYVASGPIEMYSDEEQTFKMKYAFAQLIRNGITTALPITSMFYRKWAETYDEFARSAESAAELGIRAYLGPCYMTGVEVVRADGSFHTHWDEARGLKGLADAERYIRSFDGAHGGLIRGMLAPDRIENCTPELIRRSAAVSAEYGVPVRLHCCQSMDEFDSIVARYDMTPIEWLKSLDFLSERSLLPHGVFLTGHSQVARQGDDVGILAASGATLIHCPLVLSRYGGTMESFARLRKAGIRIGLGTDTFPPDMVENMRLGISLCRVADHSVTAASAADFYDAATVHAADALGRPDLGRLAVGAKADMTLFDLSDFAIGQVIDPIQTMMLSGTGRDFRTSIINGRVVMRDRQLPGVDLEEWNARAQAQFDGLIAKYPLRTLHHPPVEDIFAPSYRVLDAG
ncbi:amidohydrolase family protein [Rhodobacter sp. SGA-6-6]|uniref:amidohydrolase family protein n=1 Tax=Rhodobacter sp. SGA-6-6 TaxID=2710882 RepID=UPI0013EC6D7C|nr:amidohydrolase family protein [Rhodobacter sp. SGA-6-6]NGM44359.1 amidohydrolase family protein [Rhodobacter sp. SGA-6-6]